MLDDQFRQELILRELNKAYIAFKPTALEPRRPDGTLFPLSAGHWGCGVFHGNKELKLLLQWIAASQAGRSIKYFTFDEQVFANQMDELKKAMVDAGVDIGIVYSWLCEYFPMRREYSVRQWISARLQVFDDTYNRDA